MQSIIDNLCRCFGTGASTVTTSLNAPTGMNNGSVVDLGEMEDNDILLSYRSGDEGKPTIRVSSTPDMKRRTRSLALQDKQWDNLFSSPPLRTPSNSRRTRSADTITLEQAHAVAKAKQEASQPNTKRKRRRGSRDDIFRSKKPGPYVRTPQHPVHRFLSNHPVLANSLCFASPVKDSNSLGEPAEVPLRQNSLQSDTNTLHTADDTVTSTVYYETTKLAGLQQRNPPMPLFDTFQVERGEEIHRIVTSQSHSSQRMLNLYNSVQDDWKQQVVELSDDDEEEEVETDLEYESPPPMTHSSSESTRSSGGKRI